MNEVTIRVVGLCYGSKSKEEPHRMHVKTIDPELLYVWEKSAGTEIGLNGWIKKELILEEGKVLAIGTICSDGLSTNYRGGVMLNKTKYLDMWIDLESSFAKKLLEMESTKNRKPRPHLCPECFERFLKKNRIRER